MGYTLAGRIQGASYDQKRGLTVVVSGQLSLGEQLLQEGLQVTFHFPPGEPTRVFYKSLTDHTEPYSIVNLKGRRMNFVLDGTCRDPQ